MGNYSEGFKKSMVQKLTVPGAQSAAALSQEVGVPQSTLSRWMRECGNIDTMGKNKRRPKDWTPAGKFKAVMEYEKLSEEERGAFLRKKGIYSSSIEMWKKEMIEALTTSPYRKKNRKDPKDNKIRELEKDLRRKEKALAETAALLVLKKKAYAIWGDPEDEQ